MRLPLFLLLLASHSAFSTEALNAYTEEFAPYNYTEGKNYKGMANQILDRIIEQSGLVIKRESQPWLRAVQNAQNDPNSILFTTVRTPQRENQYLWVGPYDDCDIVFIKLKNRGDIKINSLKEAEKYMAGAARGAAGAQVLQSLGYNMNRLDTTSPEEFRSVKMLYANRFDLSAGMLMPHIYAAKQLNFDPSQLEAAFTIIKGGGCYFAFNPKVNQPAFQRFKDAFQTLKQSGELDKIRHQYLNPTSVGQN
ncbi:transporter substrate-binding domain-containing protein [Chitinibacter bivalviorum]|uniref:Transporter substrate-binding domain-containing protein n=1 Tax=Chitinibacter bivalviorum TaxID=2739434 RepID=A0A7H9BGP2_9NEIS|nr:transporter substrate-binding domain-containing protein [Chitinibacter bivalviorum]QLG87111.1 transporter substrate-binding domain-containing protein [Chitinibacter bivalviorum]